MYSEEVVPKSNIKCYKKLSNPLLQLSKKRLYICLELLITGELLENQSISDFLNRCYASMRKGDIIIAYKGSINAEIIADTLSLVVANRYDEMEKSRTRKKVYNVLVECLQNLFHHLTRYPGLTMRIILEYSFFQKPT